MVFRSPKDYTYFMRKMQERLTEAWEILAFSLIPDEIHLVVRVSKHTIDDEVVNHSTLFSHLLNGYAQHYNYVHSRTGSLFNRSFRRQHIRSESDLQDIISKVHNLPVARNLVKQKHKWLYSSYNEIARGKLSHRQAILVIAIFGNFRKFMSHHMQTFLLKDDILPPRYWICKLSQRELEFRIRNPLGVHRWSQRVRPPT